MIPCQALNQRQAKDYFILLLLTDGILTDMQQTIHMIIGESFKPTSRAFHTATGIVFRLTYNIKLSRNKTSLWGLGYPLSV